MPLLPILCFVLLSFVGTLCEDANRAEELQRHQTSGSDASQDDTSEPLAPSASKSRYLKRAASKFGDREQRRPKDHHLQKQLSGAASPVKHTGSVTSSTSVKTTVSVVVQPASRTLSRSQVVIDDGGKAGSKSKDPAFRQRGSNKAHAHTPRPTPERFTVPITTFKPRSPAFAGRTTLPKSLNRAGGTSAHVKDAGSMKTTTTQIPRPKPVKAKENSPSSTRTLKNSHKTSPLPSRISQEKSKHDVQHTIRQYHHEESRKWKNGDAAHSQSHEKAHHIIPILQDINPTQATVVPKTVLPPFHVAVSRMTKLVPISHQFSTTEGPLFTKTTNINLPTSQPTTESIIPTINTPTKSPISTDHNEKPFNSISTTTRGDTGTIHLISGLQPVSAIEHISHHQPEETLSDSHQTLLENQKLPGTNEIQEPPKLDDNFLLDNRTLPQGDFGSRTSPKPSNTHVRAIQPTLWSMLPTMSSQKPISVQPAMSIVSATPSSLPPVSMPLLPPSRPILSPVPQSPMVFNHPLPTEGAPSTPIRPVLQTATPSSQPKLSPIPAQSILIPVNPISGPTENAGLPGFSMPTKPIAAPTTPMPLLQDSPVSMIPPIPTRPIMLSTAPIPQPMESPLPVFPSIPTRPIMASTTFAPRPIDSPLPVTQGSHQPTEASFTVPRPTESSSMSVDSPPPAQPIMAPFTFQHPSGSSEIQFPSPLSKPVIIPLPQSSASMPHLMISQTPTAMQRPMSYFIMSIPTFQLSSSLMGNQEQKNLHENGHSTPMAHQDEIPHQALAHTPGHHHHHVTTISHRLSTLAPSPKPTVVQIGAPKSKPSTTSFATTATTSHPTTPKSTSRPSSTISGILTTPTVHVTTPKPASPSIPAHKTTTILHPTTPTLTSLFPMSSTSVDLIKLLKATPPAPSRSFFYSITNTHPVMFPTTTLTPQPTIKHSVIAQIPNTPASSFKQTQSEVPQTAFHQFHFQTVRGSASTTASLPTSPATQKTAAHSLTTPSQPKLQMPSLIAQTVLPHLHFQSMKERPSVKSPEVSSTAQSVAKQTFSPVSTSPSASALPHPLATLKEKPAPFYIAVPVVGVVTPKQRTSTKPTSKGTTTTTTTPPPPPPPPPPTLKVFPHRPPLPPPPTIMPPPHPLDITTPIPPQIHGPKAPVGKPPPHPHPNIKPPPSAPYIPFFISPINQQTMLSASPHLSIPKPGDIASFNHFPYVSMYRLPSFGGNPSPLVVDLRPPEAGSQKDKEEDEEKGKKKVKPSEEDDNDDDEEEKEDAKDGKHKPSGHRGKEHQHHFHHHHRLPPNRFSPSSMGHHPSPGGDNFFPHRPQDHSGPHIAHFHPPTNIHNHHHHHQQHHSSSDERHRQPSPEIHPQKSKSPGGENENHGSFSVSHHSHGLPNPGQLMSPISDVRIPRPPGIPSIPSPNIPPVPRFPHPPRPFYDDYGSDWADDSHPSHRFQSSNDY